VRARPIIPGARVKITRACHDRTLFLNPHGNPKKGHTAEEICNFYGYATARAIKKYGVLFHGACAMGNHHHQDLTDVLGNRPNYKMSVHGVMARGTNAHLGRFDSLWSGGGSCDTETPTDEKTLRDLAYTDTNPVKDGLVKWGHLWPGFTTYGWRFGETRVFRRPDRFFDPDNPDNPETIELTRVRPPGIYPHLSDDELSHLLMKMCRDMERGFQDEMKRQNRRFMGLKKLAKQKWWNKATSNRDQFTTTPTVASGSKWKRIAKLQENKKWKADYAGPRDDFADGLDPVFPYGTYLLKQRYNVRVAPRPP